jgi:serine/threonine-protein kinase
MSPEQIRGDEIDQRSDIWGVGVVLYEALAGQFPFDPSDLRALFKSIHDEMPAPLHGVVPGVSQNLEAVVFKALDKKPARRYHDAADLALALRAAMRAEQVTV